MSISLALLAQPHALAARTIVLEALKPDVDANHLLVGQSDVRLDGDVDMYVYIDSDAYNDPTWPYRGSVDLRYKRIDLQQALGALGLRFYVGAVYSSEDIVARISNILNLQFDPTDYIHETIALTTSGAMVTLSAAPDSLRWKGQVDIFVYR